MSHPCSADPCSRISGHDTFSRRKLSLLQSQPRASYDQHPSTTKPQHTMRIPRSLTPALLLLAAGVAHAASSWGFDEAALTVSGKKGGGDGIKET